MYVDYDQLISRLIGKSVSIDVFVNSVSNEKVFNNRKIILAIIDAHLVSRFSCKGVQG